MKTIKIYTITEHPNKDAVLNWIRENWHDLNQHTIDEVIESLEQLTKKTYASLDYAISAVPERGEYISIKDIDKEALKALSASKDECPLTGCTYDYDAIECAENGDFSPILDMIHKETDFIYTDESLIKLCEANEYHFLENGRLYV